MSGVIKESDMKAGQRVRVKVAAGARKESIKKRGEHVFEISVKEKAQLNAANDRVRTLVAMYYKVPVKAVRFVTGLRSPTKTFSVVK